MFEKCGNKKYSSSEPETYFSCNLSMHALVCDDILCAYVFGTGISLGLPHYSKVIMTNHGYIVNARVMWGCAGSIKLIYEISKMIDKCKQDTIIRDDA